MPIPITCPACQSKLKIPDSFAGRKVKCPKCAKPFVAEQTAPVSADVVADETEDERDNEPVQRRKKKRKKARRSKPNNAWIWAIGVGGSVVMLGLVALLMVWLGANFMFYGIVLAISLPVSMVILLISIYISNAVGIGLDFGDAKVAIPKMIVILIAVNLVSLIPGVGFWAGLLIWIIGFMGLFELDVWEARFLFAVNLILSILFRFLLLATLLHAMHLGYQVPSTDLPNEDDDRLKAPWDQDDIKAMHGQSGVDVARAVFFIDLHNTGFSDGDFPHLAGFYKKCEELNLSENDITDKGLKYVPKFEKLKALDVTGTEVTDKGVKELQKKMPNLKITWSAEKKKDRGKKGNNDDMEDKGNKAKEDD